MTLERLGSVTKDPGHAALFFLAILLPVLLSPALALGAGREREPTLRYMHAVYRYDRTLVSHIGASKAAVNDAVARIERGCQHVIKRRAAMRHLRQFNDMGEEVSDALNVAFDASRQSPLLALVARVGPLRWRSTAITHYVDAELVMLRSKINRRMPNVCADLRAWKASGYRVLPRPTRSIVRQRSTELKHFTHLLAFPGRLLLNRDVRRFAQRLSPPLRRMSRRLSRESGDWLFARESGARFAVGLL